MEKIIGNRYSNLWVNDKNPVSPKTSYIENPASIPKIAIISPEISIVEITAIDPTTTTFNRGGEDDPHLLGEFAHEAKTNWTDEGGSQGAWGTHGIADHWNWET